jgi:hypothetical protein
LGAEASEMNTGQEIGDRSSLESRMIEKLATLSPNTKCLSLRSSRDKNMLTLKKEAQVEEVWEHPPADPSRF